MAEITDPSPELAFLGEVIAERLEDGVPPPEEDTRRGLLLWHSAMGRIHNKAYEDVSDAERAFATRDIAVRLVADLILSVTRSPVEIRLIREDLMDNMTKVCASADDELEHNAPRFQGAGIVHWATPHLAMLSDVLLDDPDLSAELSRAYVLEDFSNLFEGLMTLAWRLRAWAAVEPV